MTFREESKLWNKKIALSYPRSNRVSRDDDLIAYKDAQQMLERQFDPNFPLEEWQDVNIRACGKFRKVTLDRSVKGAVTRGSLSRARCRCASQIVSAVGHLLSRGG